MLLLCAYSASFTKGYRCPRGPNVPYAEGISQHHHQQHAILQA